MTPEHADALPSQRALETIISIGNGLFARIYSEDLSVVSHYSWRRSTKRDRCVYAQTHIAKDGKRTTLSMHNMLLAPEPGKVVDHINGDGLDNRRSNLRIANKQQNAANMAKTRGASKYKGVSWDNQSSAWRATIRTNGRKVCLGRYSCELEAAAAYNKAATTAFGPFARINHV